MDVSRHVELEDDTNAYSQSDYWRYKEHRKKGEREGGRERGREGWREKGREERMYGGREGMNKRGRLTADLYLAHWSHQACALCWRQMLSCSTEVNSSLSVGGASVLEVEPVQEVMTWHLCRRLCEVYLWSWWWGR